MRGAFCAMLFLLITIVADDEPRPRHLEEITYDSRRNKLLLFGGAEADDSGWKEPAMVHEWDGQKWTRNEAAGPTGRRGHGWVYDENRNEAILIGGVSKGKIAEDSLLFDVWHWNGNAWRLTASTCPVKEPETVYDPVGRRVLVYGDAGNKTTLGNNSKPAYELWEYKNESWQKLSAEGPDISESRMIAFNGDQNKLAVPVFEENGMTMWEWSSTGWTKMRFEKACPSYRTRFALSYDAVNRIIVLFGGLSAHGKQLGDFWKWDGKQWQAIETINNPSERNSAHFASGNDQLLLYGGSVPKPPPRQGIELCNEIWSWKKDRWEQQN